MMVCTNPLLKGLLWMNNNNNGFVNSVWVRMILHTDGYIGMDDKE